MTVGIPRYVVRGVANGLYLPPLGFFLGAVGRLLLLVEIVFVLVVRTVLLLPPLAGPAISAP